RDSLGIFISEKYPVRDIVLRLAPRWRHYVQSHHWHDSQQCQVEANGGVLLRLRVRACPELIAWILSFGEEAEVVAPEDLQSVIPARLAAGASLYAPHPAERES